MSNHYTLTSAAQACRFAGLYDAIRMRAIVYKLEVISIESKKSWLSETVYYKLGGTKENLEGFIKSLREAAEEYNNRTGS